MNENNTHHLSIRVNGLSMDLTSWNPVRDAPAPDGKQIHATIESAPSTRPSIGEYWPGQGGIYIGDYRGVADCSVYGLIVALEADIGRAAWGPNGERDLSEWDGLGNTLRLNKECQAAKLAAEYTRDGLTDFYLPARRELQLAAANVPDKFGAESWYWSSTPNGELYAWAVDFEYGITRRCIRISEFRVRPFRRFIY